MGAEIDRAGFADADRALFHRKLLQNLAALRLLLARPGFGAGECTIGAEVELYIIDAAARPSPRNQELHAALDDPQLTLELDRFNLELNLAPVAARGRPFTAIEAEIVTKLARLNEAAAADQARVIPIGILPTLRRRDFGPHAMTPLRRYEALDRAIRRQRGERFNIRIGGAEPLALEVRDLTLEGANTSLQIHCRVEPGAFARMYNALQLVTPLVLAVSCNSPLLLGRRLWQETRIPLFKLSVDARNRDSRTLHMPARVDFGSGWVREGVHELFAAAVHLHEPLLPIPARENALARVRAGKLPQLRELRLHQGTLWPWNRPVYDPGCGGHLRIEMRALPAGPSALDMMANAAFALGLAKGLEKSIDELLPRIPFAIAAHNFYRAAEHGAQAALSWPDADGALRRRPAAELVLELLPVAARGLAALQVARGESAHFLGVMRERVERGASGAAWQLRQLARLEKRHSHARALRALVQDYARHSLANLPVHVWPDCE